MLFLYNLVLPVLYAAFRLAALFDPKIRAGLRGRRDLEREVREHYTTVDASRLRVLVHVASYGELEQAKPIVAEIKKAYPTAHIHLTFFSPSGYENAVGKYVTPDFITYSPLDSAHSVRTFLDRVRPDIALFTRYDVWPNIAKALNERGIPSLLFTATAPKGSFRAYYRAVFGFLSKILVISEEEKFRFESLGVNSESIVVAGDTRFDQVLDRRLEQNEPLLPERMRQEIQSQGTLVFVVGSSWPSDEAIFNDSVKEWLERKDNILTIIAPHEPSESRVRELLSKFPNRAVRFSELSSWQKEPVIVVDSIGKLFGLYRYADIAMIGGGFGAGLHNVLEAAAWGVPAMAGPKHEKSPEVGRLIDRLAAYEVKSKQEFNFVFWRLAESEDLRKSSGSNALQFVNENRGATKRIMTELLPYLMAAEKDPGQRHGVSYDRS